MDKLKNCYKLILKIISHIIIIIFILFATLSASNLGFIVILNDVGEGH